MTAQGGVENIYDIPAAYAKLVEWGWNGKLTVRQVRGWAERKKAPFFKNPVNNRLFIYESDLRRVYSGTLTQGDSRS
jgi:hypothetical protein